METGLKAVRKIITSIIAAVILLSGIVFSDSLCLEAFALDEKNKTTDDDNVSVVFTHDMHSHMDADKKDKNGRIVENGGFARLKTVMDDIRSDYPDTFVLDAGDFSMGTPYQTIFSAEAAELKMMKYIGIEATTFGNHEFDYRASGLSDMLEAAAGNGPILTAANIDWDASLSDEELKDDAQDLKNACEKYGVAEYTVIEHNGIRAAVFGLMGENAVDYAPESGLIFRDAAETASEVVRKIKRYEQADIIICLSHCGTIENEDDVIEETEDYLLAEAVPDIDLIISGHSHTRLEEPLIVGNTQIVSCGSYNDSAGHVVLEKNGNRYKVSEYELISLNEEIEPDDDVDKELAEFRDLADSEYFNKFGCSSSQVLAVNNIDFTSIEEFGLQQGEDTLGNLIADSYKYAAAKAENGEIKGYSDGGIASGEVVTDEGGVQITVVPAGVVRGTLLKGEITTADAFNVSSLGYGRDGSAGYPLVKAYLTGAELKSVAEIDASVSNFMGVARLYCSGLEYSWNDSRLILNRAVDIRFNDGTSIRQIDNDKLYSVVTDLYSCQMLGSVNEKSFGLLKLEPKDSEGNPITDFEEHIIYDNGIEVKAWYALTSYIASFENGEIPEYYGQLQNRKTEISSNAPSELLKQPNRVFWIILTAAVLISVLIAVVIIFIVRMRRKRCTR